MKEVCFDKAPDFTIRSLHILFRESTVLILCKQDKEKAKGAQTQFYSEICFQLTLTLDRETLFKVTARPLPKGTLWMKYEPVQEARNYIYFGQ